MPKTRKKAYTKRDTAYWTKKQGKNGNGNGAGVSPLFLPREPEAEKVTCALCLTEPLVSLSVLSRGGKAILLCKQDLKRFVNGETLL